MSALRRPCLGCGRLVRGVSRCADCATKNDKRRGTRQERGYGTEHVQQRQRWAPHVATGQVLCARCHQPIPPCTPWDLGHNDERTGWSGPEHAVCNRSAGGKAASHG